MKIQDKLTILPINKTHTEILRQATLYNVNWEKEHLSLDGMDTIDKIAHYYKWNDIVDFGFIAFNKSEIVGAVWLKFFDSNNAGYGFVREGVPELSICAFPNYRNKGVGKFLLETIIDKAMQQSLPCISLSVEKENVVALKLYQSFGFKIQTENRNDYVMLLTFDSTPS